MRQIIITIALALCCVTGLRAQTLAAHTDVALLAAQTYNLGAELTVGNRTTLNLDGLIARKPYWSSDAKAYALQPEIRYYFGGRPMYHHFVGISAIAAKYDLKFNDNLHSGQALGGGLTFGYVIPLGHYFTIDAHGGLGIVAYHDAKNNDPNGKQWGYTLAPTKVGVTLSYIIR